MHFLMRSAVGPVQSCYNIAGGPPGGHVHRHDRDCFSFTPHSINTHRADAPDGWDYERDDRRDVWKWKSLKGRQERVPKMPSEETNEVKKDSLEPDTPEEAALRARWEAELLEEHGEAWMEEKRGLMDSQWRYLKRGFLQTRRFGRKHPIPSPPMGKRVHQSARTDPLVTSGLIDKRITPRPTPPAPKPSTGQWPQPEHVHGTGARYQAGCPGCQQANRDRYTSPKLDKHAPTRGRNLNDLPHHRRHTQQANYLTQHQAKTGGASWCEGAADIGHHPTGHRACHRPDRPQPDNNSTGQLSSSTPTAAQRMPSRFQN